MKKTLLLLFVFAVVQQNYSQGFAPVGAIWHYTQRTINPSVVSYKTIESVSDTIINDVQCKKMIEVERYLDTINITYRYMYSENDSVFFYSDGNFHLLYDFGANTGDTVILEYFITNNGTPLKMIIDSTATITVDDEERKFQYITSGDGISVEFGDHIIDGIGNTSFMFPTYDGSVNGPLRCYEDSETALFLNPYHPGNIWNQQDCEEIFLDMQTPGIETKIKAYPNPARGYVVFELPPALINNTAIQKNTVIPNPGAGTSAGVKNPQNRTTIAKTTAFNGSRNSKGVSHTTAQGQVQGFDMTSGNDETVVVIVNVFGQQVASLPITSEKTVWNTGNVENGIYFYSLKIEGEVLSGKVVVQK